MGGGKIGRRAAADGDYSWTRQVHGPYLPTNFRRKTGERMLRVVSLAEVLSNEALGGTGGVVRVGSSRGSGQLRPSTHKGPALFGVKNLVCHGSREVCDESCSVLPTPKAAQA